MRSALPKVLHRIAGRTLLDWAVDAALGAGANKVIVVTGHDREAVEASARASFGTRVDFAHQSEQLGTGHAVRCALAHVAEGDGHVLILYGDCPLLEPATLSALVAATRTAGAALGLVTMKLDAPAGYGRIIRNGNGEICAIREHKDTSLAERQLNEVNPGVYAIANVFLHGAVAGLRSENAQGEFYLTDLVELACIQGKVAEISGSSEDLLGVNDRLDLARCASIRRKRIVRGLALAGVEFDDLDSAFIDATAHVAPDVRIGAGVHLRGVTSIGARTRVDVGCVLTNVVVAEDTTLHPYTVAQDSTIGDHAEVGPFSHLRTDTELGSRTKVGNFTETKKTRLGVGSKVNHLAYVGNGEIGERVNVGAGTIFCNYDGFVKSTTVLEDDVFIGSDSQLVAPVRVGRGAYVASGTTVTRDVPADALAISRTKQENKLELASKLRARGLAAKQASQNLKSK